MPKDISYAVQSVLHENTDFVYIAYSVNEEGCLKRDEGNEGCNCIYWNHDHDAYNHPKVLG